MNTPSKSSTVVALVLATFVLVGGAGCGTKSVSWKPSEIFSLDSSWPFGGEAEPEEGVPVRLVGAWTDTMMTKPGQKAQRGFGGRIMFYGEEGEQPILVDGQLVVYAFDEAGREPTNNKPTRRYVFPADQVRLRMSKSDVGASYNFWLPWDEAGGPKTEVSLICRFEPKEGPVVTGEQTRHLLPGAMPEQTAAVGGSVPKLPEGEPSRPARPTLESLQSQQQVHSGAQLASFESAAAQPAAATNLANTAATAPARQMSVTSITLPDNFQLPDAAAYARAAASADNQVNQPPQAMQPTLPVQYQQPAASVQPMNPSMHPPVMNGASMIQQMPQMPSAQYPTGAGPMPQRPILSAVAAPNMHAATNNSLGVPFANPPYAAQQPAAQVGAIAPQQPVTQMAPQQGWQQLPAATGLRMAVGYPPPGATTVR